MIVKSDKHVFIVNGKKNVYKKNMLTLSVFVCVWGGSLLPSSAETAVVMRAYGPFTSIPVEKRTKIFQLKQAS